MFGYEIMFDIIHKKLCAVTANGISFKIKLRWPNQAMLGVHDWAAWKLFLKKLIRTKI